MPLESRETAAQVHWRSSVIEHIREAIDQVVSGRSLSMEDASAVMRQIMEGKSTPA